MEKERIVLNEARNVNLTAYVQSVGGEFGHITKRPAVLILPGGGYQMCSDREADPVAFPYLQAGYQVFILRYSVGEDSVWPTPLEDYEEAMEYIASRSEEWNVLTDKVVVIGFSAGGHLAACAATMSRNRPYAAILGYPVIEGECARIYQKTAPDVIGAVDEKTCPCFVFATRTDNVVPVKNTIHFLDALDQNEIMFESHIYSHGSHGFSVCNASVQSLANDFCNRVPGWVNDSIEWLKDILGDFGNGKMQKPRLPLMLNGNKESVLNVDCTVEYLMAKPEATAIITPLLQQKGNEEQAQNAGMGSMEDALEMVKSMPLRKILSYASVPEAFVDQIDGQLRQIINER